VQRTLRRQAQEFLERPFVNRQAKLFEYTMSPGERALYDDVTKYLLEPGIIAFQGRQRKLLLLGFHRRMASSTHALAASLERVKRRLHRKLSGDETPASELEDATSVTADLEDDDDVGEDGDEAATHHSPDSIRQEIARIEGFVTRAQALGAEDSKFRALLQAVRFVAERAERGQGAGKLVIFTESCVTQEYLRDRLLESRLVTDGDITLFRGHNAGKRVDEALSRWREESPQNEGHKPSHDICARLALVHEFKTRSKIFISTEAGGKGLNLQFCDTLVNYDLPWNPQRIEQRIGRCHRYGQQNDVTVINFLAKDNEAQWLTFEILSQKLELFGTVLDASDQVLHHAAAQGGANIVGALGASFEAELRRIYDRCRTLEEVTTELRALRDRVAEDRARFEDTRTRTTGLIENHLDRSIQGVFRSHRENVPVALAELDRDLVATVLCYLDALPASYERLTQGHAQLLRVAPSPLLPSDLRDGISVALGAAREHTSLHLNHPLVVAAIADARKPGPPHSVTVTLPPDAAPELRACSKKSGRLRLVKVSFNGFEQVDVLVPVVVLNEHEPELLAPELGDALLRSRFQTRVSPRSPQELQSEDVMADAASETLFAIQANVDAIEHSRFEQAQRQAERFIEDRLLVLNKRHRLLGERHEQAQRARDRASGSHARTEAETALVSAAVALEEIEGAITRLEGREDQAFRTYQEHIHKRRYTPPQIEHIFDVDLVIE
jgi:hypothetical protein